MVVLIASPTLSTNEGIPDTAFARLIGTWFQRWHDDILPNPSWGNAPKGISWPAPSIGVNTPWLRGCFRAVSEDFRVPTESGGAPAQSFRFEGLAGLVKDPAVKAGVLD